MHTLLITVPVVSQYIPKKMDKFSSAGSFSVKSIQGVDYSGDNVKILSHVNVL